MSNSRGLEFNEPGARRLSSKGKESAQALNAILEDQRRVKEDQPVEPVELPRSDVETEEHTPLKFDDFEPGSMKYTNTHFDNERVRKGIEARATDLDFTELMELGKIRQTIDVFPGRYKLVLQTIGGDEDLFIKSQLYNEPGSDAYIMDLYTMMRISMYVHTINGVTLPSSRNEKGDLDVKQFKTRWTALSEKTEAELEVLSSNCRWFHDRVQQAWVFDAIKNG